MRKLLPVFAILITMGTLFQSCQKDYDTTPDVDKQQADNPLSGHLTFNVDSFKFKSEVKYAQIQEVNGVKNLIISGTKYADNRVNGTYEQLVITIGNYNPENKKFNFGSQANITYSRVDGSETTVYNGQAGENSFVYVEGTYKGYFNTVVTNSKNSNDKIVISNGSFDIPK
ncbi:MAG TPA: hypothetical protein PKX92_08825 [Edaphocola sp.]|nr:hypothetical protein [Edaphocola sp.]